MTSRVLLEAELILAPEKVRATFIGVASGVAEFKRLLGRDPSIRVVGNTILTSLILLDADRDDVQWMIDADFMPAEFMNDWEAARAHA